LIDGTERDVPDEPYTLVIAGRSIQAVAPQSQLPCPKGAAMLDLRGMTVMPGIIDCHDHLADLEGGMQQRAAIPPSLAVFKAGQAFHHTLLGGFTSIRDASGVDPGMKMAVEQRLIPGLRLMIAAHQVRRT
jgi:imidazolonepropionase-like amidohydrolase